MTYDVRVVPGHERYLASKCGRLFKLNAQGFIVEKKLTLHVSGYLICGINGKVMRAHRVTALAWLGTPPDDSYEVNHKDGNKANNHVDNLEWVTKQENMLHRFNVLKNGLGETHSQSKLKESDIAHILSSEESSKFLALKFGVSIRTIQHVRKRETWKHVK